MSEPFSTRELQLLAQLETAKRIMNAQELRLRELGDDPSEAVAMIGEPVHPAIRERDEALAELYKLRVAHNTITETIADFINQNWPKPSVQWIDAIVASGAIESAAKGEVKPVKL